MQFSPNGSLKTLVFGTPPAKQFSTGTFILEVGKLAKWFSLAVANLRPNRIKKFNFYTEISFDIYLC